MVDGKVNELYNIMYIFKICNIYFKLFFTCDIIIKVCNSMTNTSSQKCYICGSSLKDMNNIEQVKIE